MSNLTYTTRPEGHVVSNGKLAILVRDNDIKELLAQIRQDAIGLQSEYPDIKPDEWQKEAERLCKLAMDIATGKLEINIFDYLPLTKSGDFPKNRNTLIAISKCGYGGRYDGYIEVMKLQARLVPAFANENAWLQNIRMDNMMILDVSLYDASKKQEPVFDENGMPRKIVVTRATYLKDNQVLPGRVYETKTGMKFLCLDHCNYTSKFVSCDKNGTPDQPKAKNFTSANVPYAERFFMYLRYTDALEKALGADTSYNHLMHVLANKKKDIDEQISMRETPRKFVKEIKTLFDPTTIKPEKFRSPVIKDQYQSFTGSIDYHFYEYEILPYTDKTSE